jgi:lysophospholipase L1-like esterase
MIERTNPAGQIRYTNLHAQRATPKIAGDGEVKLKIVKGRLNFGPGMKAYAGVQQFSPGSRTIEISKADDLPTIYLLGDSTVCDQPSEPYASWGQMLPRFFGARVAIANNAESGESLRSSLNAHRLEKVLSTMKPGDYLIIQYGHNDEKEKGDGVGAFTTYKADLKTFVAEARKRSGIPVLVTPVQRRTFAANGKITNSHGDYPEAMRQVAKERRCH